MNVDVEPAWGSPGKPLSSWVDPGTLAEPADVCAPSWGTPSVGPPEAGTAGALVAERPALADIHTFYARAAGLDAWPTAVDTPGEAVTAERGLSRTGWSPSFAARRRRG